MSYLRELVVTARRLKQAGGTKLRRRPGRVPRQRYPTAPRLRYQEYLLSVVDDIEKIVRDTLYPQLERLLNQVRLLRGDGIRADASDDEASLLLKAMRLAASTIQTTQRAETATYAVAKQVADFNRNEINRQFEALIGIDIVRSEPYLDAQLRAFVTDNVALIRSIPETRFQQLERVIYSAIRSGTRVETLREEIEQTYSATRVRAAVIARDQIGKFNGQLTQLRQEYVGITGYIWNTSQDERVRTTHKALHDTEQTWAKPPIVSVSKKGVVRRAHPGQDIQCRCNAIPKLPDDLLTD